MKHYGSILTIVLLCVGAYAQAETDRIMELPGRGFVVTEMENGSHYLSWRLLGGEGDETAFDIVRTVNGKEEKITDKPVDATTDYHDTKRFQAGSDVSYTLHVIENGNVSETVSPIATAKETGKNIACRSFDLSSVSAERIGFGDLDGDGNLDFVVKQPGDFGVDPYYKSWIPSKHPYFLEAYRHDGTPLWKYELGWSIETGTWYSPVAVYDLDGDGCAEVAVKASDGDHRDEEGHVWSGPEYITILDGKTGKEITHADWVSRDHWVDAMGPEWGYEYSSRHQIMVAYLDGRNPSLIIQRGTYDINILIAFDYRDGKLVKRWTWDNRGESSEYYAQSSHTIIPADIDSDGRDELVIGSVALNDDGTPMWSTNNGHVDAVFVADHDLDRPGLEVYYGCEMHLEKNGACMADALTGEILWGVDVPTKHVHSYGLAGDLVAETPGSEFYSRDRETPGQAWFFDAKGNEIAEPVYSGQHVHSLYWDADPQHEVLSGGISDYGAKEAIAKYNRDGNLVATADISGDWREELVMSVDGKVYIYSTTIAAENRYPALMTDPIYRLNTIGFTSGYWHTPMLSYNLEAGKGK